MGITGKSLNPLLGITVGSTVLGNDFKPSVLNSSITKMITQKEVEMGMSGKSQYVYTDSLNQGAFGMSGAIGTSGVSKFTSAVSAYISNANASEAKAISVDYNISMLSGVEYIDFDNLTVKDILNSLSEGPKKLALIVLDKFIAARDYTGSPSEKNERMKDWLRSLQDFIASYGDGLVVGAIWGGIGSVSTKMTSTKEENNWKYGQDTAFTYSGIGSSVAIGETYNGSKKEQNSDVEISCKAFSSGGCVEKQVSEWFDVVSGKAFSEVFEIKLLDKAPTQSAVSAPPGIPDFIEPEEDEQVKVKLVSFKKLGDSESFSIYSGYEEAKKLNPGLVLEDFESNVRSKNDISGLDEIITKVQENSLDVLTNGGSVKGFYKTLQQRINTLPLSSDSDYAVLGVWITNWSEILPWMSMGYMNGISDSESEVAEYILKARCMIQDLSTLNTIYNTFAACNISLDFCNLKSASQVANSFKSAQVKLGENLQRDNAIKMAFDSLSEEAKAIYETWNKLGFLRNAELGLGLFVQDHSVTNEVIGLNPLPYPEAVYKPDYCSYGDHNYTAFSSFVKLLPFIDTNGDIYAFGPSLMLLRKASVEKVIFTKGGVTAMKLVANKEKGILFKDNIQLIPIPYSAANGIEWRGQGMGKGLASTKSLEQQLEALRKDLSNLNICTLTSDSWSQDWDYTVPYNLRKLKTSYIGVVEKINSVFN